MQLPDLLNGRFLQKLPGWLTEPEKKKGSILKMLPLKQRTTGIEPASQAWEARVLPMYYVRKMSANVIISHFL